MTPRQRKLAFIQSFGPAALEDAIARYLAKNGPGFLPDDIVDELHEIEVRRRWADRRRMMANRPIIRASAGLGLASALGGMLSKESV